MVTSTQTRQNVVTDLVRERGVGCDTETDYSINKCDLQFQLVYKTNLAA